MLFAILPGDVKYDWGNSLIACLVAIILVFLVLVVIIIVTDLIFRLVRQLPDPEQKKAVKKPVVESKTVAKPAQFNENDENMVAAVMVATIDYQNEIKEDVKLVSVKEIK